MQYSSRDYLLQLSEKMPPEKKGEIFAHITNALFKWETPERWHLKEWILEPLVKSKLISVELFVGELFHACFRLNYLFRNCIKIMQ